MKRLLLSLALILGFVAPIQAQMYLPVDSNVVVLVNKVPLTDDTDFKSIEASVVFNQSGLDLNWVFMPAGGTIPTKTAVTPTDTAGVYDWTNLGDGMYVIEIPSTGGGTINNDAEGCGFFEGFATGILPWIGPVYCFTATNVANSFLGLDSLDVTSIALANGTIIAATIATDAIDADAIAASAITSAEAPNLDAAITTRLAPTTAGRTLDITATGAAGVDLDNIEGTLDAAEIGADAITAAKMAADVTTEITAGLIKPISNGTAQGPGTGNNQIQLAAAESYVNDDLINCSLVNILSGTGKGQVKIITDYVNATDTATVDSNWSINPDSTSVYQLLQMPCLITGTEFTGLVWNAATSSYVVAGSTGKALGDVNTNVGTPATLGGGATIAQNLQDLADDNTASFDRTTDSLQAIRDRGDIAWTGGGTVYSGTADSGSTTTVVDTERTEGDTDYWKNSLIRFTSGTIAGQTRYITGFTPGTDTITFEPATTQAVSTNTYELLPFPLMSSGAEVTDLIFDEALAGHTTAGTFGKKLNDTQTYKVRPRNVAVTDNPLVPFAANGTITQGASAISCEISKDGGAFAALNTPNLTEVEATNGAIWTFDLIQAETDAEFATVICSGTGMLTTAINFEFREVTP